MAGKSEEKVARAEPSPHSLNQHSQNGSLHTKQAHGGILLVPEKVLKIREVHTKSSSTLSPVLSENQATLIAGCNDWSRRATARF